MSGRPLDQSCELAIGLGAIRIKLRSSEVDHATQLRSRYQDFVIDGECDHEVVIKIDPENPNRNNQGPELPEYRFDLEKTVIQGKRMEGFFDAGQNYGELIIYDERSLSQVEYYLRSVYSLAAFNRGQVLLHAAGIVRKNQGYLFVGHSGSGKSTIVQLSPNDIVLNDDLVLLERHHHQWLAHATPCSNSGLDRIKNTHAEVKAIFCLRKSDRISIEILQPGLALAEIISNIPLVSADPDRSERLLQLGFKLCSDIQVFNLFFRKDASFWSLIDKMV